MGISCPLRGPAGGVLLIPFTQHAAAGKRQVHVKVWSRPPLPGDSSRAGDPAGVRPPEGALTTQALKVLEIIEAFAAVAITSSPMLEVEPDRVNPTGGAIAIGPPSAPPARASSVA